MKLVFAGTSSFAVPALEALVSSRHEVACVVTRPDRPAGRGRRTSPSPVRLTAEEHGLPVRTPASINAPDQVAALAALEPDVLVVAAYGRILKAAVLTLPRLGCVNVHGSLLPAWRGAAPVAHALLAGDDVTGVTLMQMDEGLDTGPILAAVETRIEPGECRGELMARLARLGAERLVPTLEALDAGRLEPRPQDDARATLAPPLKKEDGRLDWSQDADAVVRRVRAYTPAPGAFTEIDGRRLLVRRARPLPADDEVAGLERPSGTVGEPRRGQGVPVRCGGRTALLLERVQPAGKKEMDAEAAARGRLLTAGARLGTAPSR